MFSPIGQHPTLWIGVVGHRPNGLAGANVDLLYQGVRRVFEHAREVSTTIAVVSPLAEGADRVVAREALAAGYPLYCLLPFSSDDYAEDFQSASSLAEYRHLLTCAKSVYEMAGSRDTTADTEAAYAAAAETILLMVDVLIAIWDGLPARGLGGTANTVLEAVQRDIPVAWIAAQPPHEVSLLVRARSDLITVPLDQLPERIARRRAHHMLLRDDRA